MERTWLIIGALVLVLVGCGTSGETASPSTTALPTPTEARVTTSTSTSTTAAPTTTTIAPAALYGEMNAEIQRACDAAMASGGSGGATFKQRWAAVSSATKLDAAVAQCVAARRAAATTAPPPPPPPTIPPTEPPAPSAYYANCSEARAAGVTPLYRGDPGYASHLDGDDDGIACE